jgi:hypothetical protein
MLYYCNQRQLSQKSLCTIVVNTDVNYVNSISTGFLFELSSVDNDPISLKAETVKQIHDYWKVNKINIFVKSFSDKLKMIN